MKIIKNNKEIYTLLDCDYDNDDYNKKEPLYLLNYKGEIIKDISQPIVKEEFKYYGSSFIYN